MRYDQTTVVRWLFVRNIYPTNESLELALDARQSEIAFTVAETYISSVSILVSGQKAFDFHCPL